MASKTTWAGTATSLLAALTDSAGKTVNKAKEWPKTPKTLSGRLRRAAPFLRKVGIRLSFERGKVSRTIAIETDG